MIPPPSDAPRRVAILGGNRIPFARSNRAYVGVSSQDMLIAALDGLVSRFGLEGERLGEVAAGAVLTHSPEFNLIREVVLGSGLAPETPGVELQLACGTGLHALGHIANKIALRQIDSGIAGGADTTSDAPIAVPDSLRKKFLAFHGAESLRGQVTALASIRPSDVGLALPFNGEMRTGLSMGDHQALTTAYWQITREAQDEFAAGSHHKLAASYDDGWQGDLVTPYRGLTRDDILQPDTSFEKLARLKPVFGRGESATMTAGNSTPLTDGASAVLVSSEQWAGEHGFEPLAYWVDYEVAAVDFEFGGEGVLMGPAYAIPRLLARRGLSLDDIDYFEMHEAFASHVLCVVKAWQDPVFCTERLGLDAPLGRLDLAKINVKGSSLAAGHPFAATGGRMVATAAKLLAAKGGGRAVISSCALGGQGIAALVER